MPKTLAVRQIYSYTKTAVVLQRKEAVQLL